MVVEHYQKVDFSRKATTYVGGQLFGVRLPISNLPFYYFPFPSILLNLWEKLFIPKFTQIHQKIYKAAQNVDMWDERRDFWLLETWTRRLSWN